MTHPRKYDDSDTLIKTLREICLAFPETYEKEAWGECTFRVNKGTMFAMTDCDHHGSGHTAVWVKANPMVQDMMVKSDPKRFFVPPYMGSQGWVGFRLNVKSKWKEITSILRDGYEMSVPRKMKQNTPNHQKMETHVFRA
ncbi:MAG: MmcQ/YjbR family DNA-binding protein [Spirochaetia bacterium]|nr:MmcQ/YjbR family DNA-binding protein [Spirochaetia bacterium]